MLRRLRATDPALDQLLTSTQARLDRIVAHAEPRARAFYARTLGRELGIREAVATIFAEVERDGDAAVARYNRLFDGCELAADELLIGPEALRAAWEGLEPELRSALHLAAARIEAYQRRLLPRGFGEDGREPLGCRWLPLDRVGAYVPGGAGGSVPLCSTVLMNLIPAKVAGVAELIVVTPPRADGSVHPAVLAAAHRAGVSAVYRAGGVQGIAALACGSASLAKVDKIVGPGNIFVTLAKREAYGRVDIDMLAGPSEVLVIADAQAEPALIAADLLSQAEHDPVAMPVLVTTSAALADAVDVELARQLAALPEANRRPAEASVRDLGLCVVVDTLDEAVAVSERVAPEHLELLVQDPQALLPRLRHAGAIFIGRWSPEPIGDYCAGPSHTLPTCGSARMWSGIGADTFLKRSSVIALDEAGFRELADTAILLARAEGLEAHARAVEIRTGSGPR